MRLRPTARHTARLTVLSTTLLMTAATLTGLETLVAAPATAASSVTVYPVPTPGAGPGRISTAPDGTMWFVERSSHKVARLTPSGQMNEIAFPSQNPGPQLIDLDITTAGTIWVVYDSGRLTLEMDGTGKPIRPVGGGQGFLDAVAGSVRIAGDGVVWNSILYPASGRYSVARTFATGETETADDSSPACDGPLGAGSDGSMWCRSGDAVLHLAIPPQGSATLAATQTFLGGAGGLVPRALAAGPVGSIWFSRYADPTATTPPRGEVGYIDAATGVVRTFSTGAGSAPGDLRLGPDGAMWFVNGGAQPGIGRIDANGQGSLTTYGGAVPSALTFSRDGALWFTDATNNTVTRVAPAKLPQGTAATTQLGKAGKGKAGRSLRVKKNKVTVTLSCPTTTIGSCSGPVQVLTNRKVRKPGKKGKKAKSARVRLTKPNAFALPPGGSAKLRLTLTKNGRALARNGLKVRIQSGPTTLGRAKIHR